MRRTKQSNRSPELGCLTELIAFALTLGTIVLVAAYVVAKICKFFLWAMH